MFSTVCIIFFADNPSCVSCHGDKLTVTHENSVIIKHEINQIKPSPCLSSPNQIQILDPAPSKTSLGLWWDGLHVLMFCHWFSKALREGRWVVGPSDSLSLVSWFMLWSEQKKECSGVIWMRVCPLSKGKCSQKNLSHATYDMIGRAPIWE